MPACDAFSTLYLLGNAIRFTPLFSVHLLEGLYQHVVTEYLLLRESRAPGQPVSLSSFYVTALPPLLGKHNAPKCPLHQT